MSVGSGRHRTVSVRHALFGWFLLLLCISGGLLWAISQSGMEELFRRQAESSLAFEVKEKAEAFSHRLSIALGHLRMLRDHRALRERAALALAGGEGDWQVLEEEIETLFRIHLDNVPMSYQIRLISAAPGNRELIRMVRAEGRIERTPSAELQRKEGRDYVAEALELAPGAVSCSRIDLNREWGEIEKPHRITHRLFAPIHDAAGAVLGFVVINQEIGGVLERLAETFPWPARVQLVNEQGGFLLHPEKGRAFAFEFGDRSGLAEDSPEAWRHFQGISGRGGGVGWRGEERLQHLYAFAMSEAEDAHRLGLMVAVEERDLLPAMSASLRQASMAGLLVIFLGVIVAYLASMPMTRPLTTLTEAVRRFSHGIPPQWGERGHIREVESLRDSFAEMGERIETARAALDTERSSLNALLDSAVDGIIIIDRLGVIQRVNPAAERLFGYPPGALNGEKVNRLMPSPHREHHEEYIARYLNERENRLIGSGVELTACRHDGTPFPILLALSTFESEGEPYFTGVIHDLSERVALEEQLKRNNQELERRVAERTLELVERNDLLGEEVARHRVTRARLHLSREIVARSRQAILITDAANHIIEVNDAYVEMTGFSRLQALGSKPSISKSGRHDPEFYRELWRALEEKNHWEGEMWDRREDGTLFPKYLTIDRLLNERGEVENYVAMFEDLSEQKATEEALERVTHYDQLTGLSNRVLFRHRLDHEFDVSQRHRRATALVLINLDRFKQVNDTLGFLIGDRLIRQVAKRLEAMVRKSDLVARDDNRSEREPDTLSRMGGDEFAVILADLEKPANAGIVAQRFLEVFEAPFVAEGQEVHLSASMGIAVYPDNAENQGELVLCAERAMDDARAAGGNAFRFYSEEMNRSSADRFRMEGEMRKALAAGEFTLFYQPKVELEGEVATGMEALVRWRQEDGTMVSPGEFIPLAEETGLIVPLGEWILERACADTQALSERLGRPLKVAVNLSAKQFQFSDVVGLVERVLDESGLPPAQLELEITESMVMGNVEQAIETMARLSERGVSLAIDDFGTGYSSLAYLKRFPVHTLKIDQSFVRDLEVDGEDAAIVATICSMGRQLGLSIVAEGIESATQLAFLAEQGCDFGQGFHLCRPLPLDRLEAWLEEG